MIVGQPERHLQVKDLQQLDEVIGPAGRDGAGAHGVLQREIPSDNPGENFAKCRVGVGIGAAGEGNHGSKLSVAETCEGAAQPRQDEGKHETRAGVMGPQAGKDEDTCANDGAHSQRG